MKLLLLILALSGCALCLALSGCGLNDDITPPLGCTIQQQLTQGDCAP